MTERTNNVGTGNESQFHHETVHTLQEPDKQSGNIAEHRFFFPVATQDTAPKNHSTDPN